MCLMKIATGLAVVAALLPATIAARVASSTPLDGTYRVTWTEKELVAAGASHVYAHANVGFADGKTSVWTMTLRGGQLRLRVSPPTCIGTYGVSGSTVSIQQKQGCRGLVVARWSLTTRQLRLRVLKATDPGDRVLFGAKPWKKIG